MNSLLTYLWSRLDHFDRLVVFCCLTKIFDIIKKGFEQDTFIFANGEQSADARFLVDAFQIATSYANCFCLPNCDIGDSFAGNQLSEELRMKEVTACLRQKACTHQCKKDEFWACHSCHLVVACARQKCQLTIKWNWYLKKPLSRFMKAKLEEFLIIDVKAMYSLKKYFALTETFFPSRLSSKCIMDEILKGKSSPLFF